MEENVGENTFTGKTPPWPESWVRTYYKIYPRFRRIKLVPDSRLPTALSDVLHSRASADKFSGGDLTLKQVSNLFHFAAGENPARPKKRMYPSGGARYPLEVYPLVLRSEELKRGLYHFNVRDNELEFMWREYPEDIHRKLALDWQRWTEVSAFLFITAVMSRNTIKYGPEKGKKLVTLEAGILGAYIYLVATALNLECRAIGGFSDEGFVCEFLDIDGINEKPVYMFAIGAPRAG